MSQWHGGETGQDQGRGKSGDAANLHRALWGRLTLAGYLAFATLLSILPAPARGRQDRSGTAEVNTSASRDTATKAPQPLANGKNRIKVRVEVVNVPVTVLAKDGLPVIDLSRNDFKVYEDGKLQTIRYFSSEMAPPLRVGLVLDTSNSARLQLKFEKDAAREFAFETLRGLHSRNRVFLQTFDSTSTIVQDFTDDPNVLNDKITKLKAGGGKAVYDAIYEACEHEIAKGGPREQTRRVLILVSDGLDVQSKHTLEEAVSMAHRAETVIYAIGNVGYGYENPGEKDLRKIAEQTGGTAFFPRQKSVGADLLTGYLSHGQFDNLEQNKGLGAETGIYTAGKMIALADSLDSIRRELANQYVIGYVPTDRNLDGTYRSIRVVTLRKGLIVRYKPGYYATPE